jgi:predicted RNA-binding Zn-ribbon protein involved in translation (DUF1610 family)
VEVFVTFHIPEREPLTFGVYEASFKEKARAVDEFIEQCLHTDQWVSIGEARANLIPKGKAGFECPNCGWVCEDLEKENENFNQMFSQPDYYSSTSPETIKKQAAAKKECEEKLSWAYHKWEKLNQEIERLETEFKQ